MRRFIIDGNVMADGEGNLAYIVAEIGANHQGNIEKCKEIVRMAIKSGVDAVKMQKRNNKEMFHSSIYNSPYENENSFGATYGEHREKLDWFGEEEYLQIMDIAREGNVHCFATPFDFDSLYFCREMNFPVIKIASCDLKNTALISEASKGNASIIISTGGGKIEDIERAYRLATAKKKECEVALLHCISKYPNSDNLSLKQIDILKHKFPESIIGFSSHHPGLLPIYVAYCHGARIFEVHVTLNRANKGTDNPFSLEEGGLSRLCEDIRRIPEMEKVRTVCDSGFVRKFGKAIYTQRDIKSGQRITSDDICLKAPADSDEMPIHIWWYRLKGGNLTAKIDIAGNTLITRNMIGKENM